MSTAFISYGGPDEDFAARLNKTLNDSGIKTFFFPIHAKPGEKLHHLMRDGINKYDKIVFICSQYALSRPGVLNELEEALQREAREGGEQILIPINLDNYVFTGWDPKRPGLKQAILDRVVGNFVDLDNDKYINSSRKLVAALDGLIENSFISWNTTLDLNDTGSKCVVNIERRFITYLERDQVVYHGLNSTGSIKPISTSFGKIDKIVTEGGNKAVYVKFDNPLPVNVEITHSLVIEHINAFTESCESYSNHGLSDFEDFSIIVNFPSKRLVKDAYLKLTYNGKVTINRDHIHINTDKSQVKLFVKKPLIGAYYTLEWVW